MKVSKPSRRISWRPRELTTVVFTLEMVFKLPLTMNGNVPVRAARGMAGLVFAFFLLLSA